MVRPCKPLPDLSESDKRRFFSRLKINESTGCHERQGFRNRQGYGVTKIGKVSFYSHRVAYFLKYGEQPGDLCVCHRCDNPICCNPEHLFLGTRKENNADMFEKGRSIPRVGSSNGSSKLTETDVLKIRDLHGEGILSRREIGEQFNISTAVLSQITRCKVWKHIIRPKDLEIAKVKRSSGRPCIGEKNPRAILKAEDVLRIRELYAAGGITQVHLGKIFGVRGITIYHIVKRRNWTHI